MSKLDQLKSAVGRNIGAMPAAEPALVKTFHERLNEVPPSPARPEPLEARARQDDNKETKSKPAKKSEPKTGRIERLSVSMPTEDLARITKVRKRAARRGDIYPKSHIVRAALIHLDSLEDNKILEILENVAVVKSGKEHDE